MALAEQRSSTPAGAAKPVEVVAVVTSAGGLQALSTVLGSLAEDFPAAIVVSQHLSGSGSSLVRILERRVALPVEWATDGMTLRPGRVLVSPARSVVEVLPDGSCAVRPSAGTITDRPLDALLASVGDSYGARALGVVLTGMGNDGAQGVAALKAAGAVVIAQDAATADEPAMPGAALDAGADLALPLDEIGAALVDLAWGRDLPRPTAEIEAIRELFGDQGEVAALAMSIDWRLTPLGPVEAWPNELRTTMRLAVASPTPVAIFWTADLLLLYNEAAVPTVGGRLAEVFARPFREAFPEARSLLDPVYEQVMAGTAVSIPGLKLALRRFGRTEDAWFDVTYTPIHDAQGAVGGFYTSYMERTAEVLAARRLAVLNALGSASRAAGPREALAGSIEVLEASEDVVFAIAYLVDHPSATARLVSAVGVEEGSALAPRLIRLAAGSAWPLNGISQPVVVDNLDSRFPGQLVGADAVTPKTAVVLPLTDKADDQLVGTLVLGVDPLLPFDDRYREFLALVSEAVAARMSEAHARQREHQRLQRLAELDRAKTEFFSNVSHEFRTPLTLMLGPLEDALRDSDAIPPRLRDELELARRNARRLLRLVGTMLDFSQIEAGRLRAHFAPVDLAERTRDIVAQFESAADRAGVRLNVELDELPQPVWVDVEMWEKIVSNLLSNALKFTFDGEIDVALHALPGHAELVVRDTGVGIPAEELPHIFKRFHRVRDTRARTYEGAGIGLALVNELVRRHHGRIRATSTLGDGTTFTVWIPTGRRPTMPGAAPVAPTSTASVAVAMAEEALRWGENPEPPTRHEEGDESALRQSLRAFAPDARLLVADDSSDMREYLQRLLGVHWKVDTASDGAEALALARRNRPDLVVADVMMPGLDGFALLRELRDDPTLQTLPVVLVTARAGEESAIEGLLAGADDYIVKPFSARELVARVGGQLELARTRKQAVELNEFLVRFSDTARTLPTPETVAETACRMLVNELRANRAAWAEIDRDAGAYIADIVVLADGTPAEPSRGPLDESEAFTAEHRAGRSVVYTDITKEQRISDDAKREMERRGLRSGIAAPVCVAEELRLVLSVSDEEPRVWTSKEVALVEALAGRAWAEVERARVEAALRAREEWQSFILRLSDVLRPLDDPTEIKAAAARLLAEHLAVTRAEYFEADSSGEYLETVGGYADGELGRVGRVPIAALGEAVASSFRAARTVAIADFREDPLIAPEERPAYETRDFRAFVGAPLFKGGRLVAMLVAVDAAVRQWTPDEVALVEETAERTWSAVERTRAEGTLREREQQQAFLLTVSEAVQRLTDASQIQAAAGNLLRERLAVSRVFFSEMEGDEWIVGEVYGDSATIAPGRYPAGEYGRWTMDTLRAGRVIAIEDTATAAELRPSEREALQRIGNRAVAGVPLLRDGEIAAVLTVHHSEPRPWTQTDLTLLRETAERTWPAVERARAERALRERDGQLQ